MGPAGVPWDAQGVPSMAKSALFKYDDGSLVQGRIYVLHNTIWADPSLSASITNGGADYGGGSGGALDAFYLRNNIIRGTSYAFVVDSAGMWNEDYNSFSTSDVTRGLQYLLKNYTTSVATYRLDSGQGAHTNINADFITAPVLNNPLAGDITLPTVSPLIDAGVRVPNLSDRPGVDFMGAAPDLGATEES
jgi:hypothetical protein